MGRASRNTVSKKKQSSKKSKSSVVPQEKGLKVFASFIVDRILEEQEENLSKDIPDK